MRKIWSCAVCVPLLVAAAGGFSACGEKAERSSYVIRAEYFPEERKLSAEMDVSVRNDTDDALSELSFQLWANAYREGAVYRPVSDLFSSAAYYDGPSYGGISVSEVEGAKSYAIGGEDENVLAVSLEEPLYPDERAELSVTFEVTLARVAHRLGEGRNVVNLTGFYPVLCASGENGFLEYVYSSNGDPFVGECADYDVTLTFPEKYEAACGGASEVTVENGKKTVRATAENVRDVAFVLGEGLSRLSERAGETEIDYYYFSDASPERTLKAARDAVGYFSRTFGDYPYPRYVVVETEFPYGGMEYSGLSMISASLRAEEVPAVVAHETAHQWWYASVGSNQFEHAWQDEGLAEYSAALFLDAFPEYGGGYRELVSRSESSYRAYYSVLSQVSKEADTTMDRPLTAFSGEYEYRNIAYDKGVILFDRVRSVAGERKFFAGLKEYASAYAGKIAEPVDLIACFRKAGGNVEELFASFLEGRCVL